jgi:hypothetical protein
MRISWLYGHGKYIKDGMDKVGGSMALYGEDIRTNTNKTEHHTYDDDDEFFISFKMHRSILSPASISCPAREYQKTLRRCLPGP